MANFLLLVKVQLLSLFGTNKMLKSTNKKKALGIGGVAFTLLLLGGTLLFFGYTYSLVFAEALKLINEEYRLIPTMLAISCIICFIFSFYAIGSMLFGFKDYDMLMSMPIKPVSIVLSKFTVLYIGELFFTLLLVIPSLFVYNEVVGALSAFKIMSSVVMCLVSPLLPFAVSTALGVIVYYVSSRFKRKNVIQIILLFGFLIAFFAFSFLSGMSYGEDEAVAVLNSLQILDKIYFILPWAIKVWGNPIWLLAFVSINVAPITVVVIFVCVFYKKLNTIFTSKHTDKNFKLRDYQTNGIGKTLFNKEVRRLFSSPVYAVNTLSGSIMAIIASVGYSVAYAILIESSSELEILFKALSAFIPAIFSFMFILSPATAASISLEGQNVWILKTAPISYMHVLNAKLNVHALFSTLVALVCSLVIAIFTNLGWIGGVLLVIIAISMSTFGGILGLLFNLRFPKLDWDNENVPVKQGLPVFLTMLCAFFFTAVIVVIGMFVNVLPEILLCIYATFFTVLSIVLYVVLIKCGDKLFEKLN